MTAPATPRTARTMPVAARIALSLVALVVLGYWMLWSWLLLVIRCGDSCSGDPAAYERWQYTGQFLLAAPCAAAGVLGLALGFTRSQRTSGRLLGVAAAGGLVWLLWVLGFGAF